MNFLDQSFDLDGVPLNTAVNRLDLLRQPETPADRKAPAPARRLGLFRLVASDLRAKAEWNYGRVAFATLVKVILTDGTAAMIWYRLMQWARRWRLGPLGLLFNRINTFY